MTAKTLCFIRHGETGFVKENRFYGSTDLALSEEGQEQARSLRPWLAALPCKNAHIYSSPRRRVLETLQAALPGAEPIVDADLREMDFGQCEGMTIAEIKARFPQTLEQWANFSPELKFPGGESLADYLERIQRAAARLAASPGENLLVFSHGGVIRSLLCQFLHLPPRAYSAFQLPCAGVAIVSLSGGYGVLTSLGRMP